MLPRFMFYYSIGPLLNINDLQYVLDTLNEAGFSQGKWRRLCGFIGLYGSTLNTIKAEYSGDEQGCLRQCLVKWLEGADGATGGEGQRMTSLCEVLEGIGEKAAADYISKLYYYYNFNTLYLFLCGFT